MDGLMIDTEPLYKRAFQKAGKESGYDLSDSFMMRLVGRPDSDCRNIISDQFGAGFPMDAFWELWPKLWREEATTQGIKHKPGLAGLLSYIQKLSIPAAIATSTYHEQAVFTLKTALVSYPFHHIVTGNEVTHGKPAPDIYLEAARRLGANPQNCIVLEDSENGVRAAAAAGMITIMVPDLIQPSEEVRKLASFVVESLNDVQNLISEMQISPVKRTHSD